MSLMVAGAVMALLGQHLTFLRIMHSFDFLRTEAPQINSLVYRATMKASSYRIHLNKADALARTSAVNREGHALRLIYRNPDDSIVESVLAFESVNGKQCLNFYHNDGGGWTDSPDWSLTQKAQGVTFNDESGILLMTLQGPAQEEIVYAATAE